jgi:hypothetical protein
MASTKRMMSELAQVGAKLAEVDDLYQRRADLMVALRKVDPPVKIRELAEVAQISEGAATQVLRAEKQKGRL